MTYNPPALIPIIILSFNGTVFFQKKIKKNTSKSTMYISPTKSIIVVEDNKVSSIKKTNTQSVADKLKGGKFNMVATFKDSSKNKTKVCKIDHVKPVKMNGKKYLKIKVSHDDSIAFGTFASNSLSQFNDDYSGEMFFTMSLENDQQDNQTCPDRLCVDCRNGYMDFPLAFPFNRRSNGFASFNLSHEIRLSNGMPVRTTVGRAGIGRLYRTFRWRLPCARPGQIPDWPSCSQGNCPPGTTIG
jgi:hypothetical protein